MTQEEINKGSRLIESIMGSTIKIKQEDVKDIPLAFLQPEDMKFHESWKWLMPVVVKIENDMGHTIVIKGTSCEVITKDGDSYSAEEETKLKAVWQAIVDFLDAEN
ncbi:hypothetical protein [Fodinibius halophilus]|uniref:Uncharacterized protein n=1 Tax=Fodinibius halophilus TaxID=1736908 RepID=A0A6M1SYL8_9BACT|nr:hypothetical protein [Fodinibius halophilus]NGP86727.1 hypothetical protein [Fodinibius halophilus]